jgi:hypothetical protein
LVLQISVIDATSRKRIGFAVSIDGKGDAGQKTLRNQVAFSLRMVWAMCMLVELVFLELPSLHTIHHP